MDAFQDLLTQSSGSQVSPELLEMLGRKAAQMFTAQGVPLNDGVRQVLADQPNLGTEHIRRIVEFANNAAFQELFEKGTDKNVHFPVADPGVVLRDARDGGTPAQDGKTLSGKDDFKMQPRHEGDLGEAELHQLFAPSSPDMSAGPPLAKAASAETMEVPHAFHANPVEDVYDAHVRMQGNREILRADNDVVQMKLKTAQQAFYEAVKNEVLSPEGAGLGGVLGALEKVAGSDRPAGAVRSVVVGLIDEGIPPILLEHSLTKMAGRVVNPEHQIIQTFLDLEKTAMDRLTLETAIKDLDQQIEKTAHFLRTH